MLGQLRKLLPYFSLACAGLFCYFATLFCTKKTDGFSIAFVHSDLSYHPTWETREKNLQELENIFSQKFHYLGCGGQSFVFVSEDNDYVIKFFKHRKTRKPWLRFPVPGMEHSRLKKLNRALFKLNRDFTSYKIAFEELREETGLIYLHLNKGTGLNRSLRIVDKIGIEHEIDLDKIEFIVQKRAELLYPRIQTLMETGDAPSAKQAVNAILETIVSRCKKGIFDEDPRIHNNLGLLREKAIFIDVGRFVHDTTRMSSDVYINDLKIITGKRFRPWLERNYPELAVYLDEEIERLEVGQ